MKKLLRYITVSLFIVMFVTTGCSHHVALNKDTLQKNQTVSLKLNSGDNVNGVITTVKDQSITVNNENNNSNEIQKNQITEITGPQPFYDSNGTIISEKEIAAVKTKKKFWTYTISGGLVSAGASFFLSSMIARSSSDDIEDPIILSGTAAGTVVGGWLFSRMGNKRDRLDAVDNIRLTRGGKDLSGVNQELEKQKKVQQQLERLKKEREAQEQEIQKLRQKVEEEN